MTNINFITKANNIHNNKYNYSLVDYKNSKTKVKIICPKHGIFEQRPNDHLSGSGCPKCNILKQKKEKTLNSKKFINKAISKHTNKYDYSLVKYIDNKTKVKIICPKHGIFEQRPNNHLQGQRCPKCYGKLKKNTEEFINIANHIHNNVYDYSLTHYKNSKTKVKIICPKHGIFEQRPNDHLRGQSCPKCYESNGEKKIRLFLENKKINYIPEKKFLNCKNKKLLSFDFYLPDYNILIEYDGIQHFQIKEYFGGEDGFNQIKMNDDIKNNFAISNHFILIRISYWMDVDEKLSEIL